MTSSHGERGEGFARAAVALSVLWFALRVLGLVTAGGGAAVRRPARRRRGRGG